MAKLCVAISVLLVVLNCHATFNPANKSQEKNVKDQVVVHDNVERIKNDPDPNAKPKKQSPVNVKRPVVVKVKTNEISTAMKLLKTWSVYDNTARSIYEILSSLFKFRAVLGDIKDEAREEALPKIMDCIFKQYVAKEETSELQQIKSEIQALAKPGKKDAIFKKQNEAMVALRQAMNLIEQTAQEQAILDKGTTVAKKEVKAKPDQQGSRISKMFKSLADKNQKVMMAWMLYEGIFKIAKAKKRFEIEHPSTHPPKQSKPNPQDEDAHDTAHAPHLETGTSGSKGKNKANADSSPVGFLLYAYGLKHFRVSDPKKQAENDSKADELMKNAQQKMGPDVVKQVEDGVTDLQKAYVISLQMRQKKNQPKQGQPKKQDGTKKQAQTNTGRKKEDDVHQEEQNENDDDEWVDEEGSQTSTGKEKENDAHQRGREKKTKPQDQHQETTTVPKDVQPE